MKRLDLRLPGVLAAAGLALAANGARAQDAAADGWTFTAAPYLWVTGLSGTVGAGGTTADVDMSFSDIMENFDIGAMGVFEARRGKFGFFTDVSYVSLSAESDTPRGFFANGVSVGVDSLMWTAMGEYRVVDTPDATVDALAGFRLFSVHNELAIDGNRLLDDQDASLTQTWVDPMIGVKARFNLSPDFYATGWAMVGGFGVSSDITWDVMAGVGYAFSESISAVIGYRVSGVDYSSDDFTYDTVQQGPVVGLVFTF
jgi:hypothetical protein